MVEEAVEIFTISCNNLQKWRDMVTTNTLTRFQTNVITSVNPKTAALDRERCLQIGNHVFSIHKVKEVKPITLQASSGRCWIFAAMNVLRIGIAEELKLEEFELSQSYLYFYDQLERCNWFLQNIIDTADQDLDSRLVQYLLGKPLEDGGQYDMIANIIEKYGVVPKDCFPESFSSSESRHMWNLLRCRLRDMAKSLRNSFANGVDKTHLKNVAEDYVGECYRILAVHLGSPPLEFDWSYRDKEKSFNRVRTSPKEFYERFKFINDFKTKISFVHDPRNEYWRLYTVERLGNVVSTTGILTGQVRYINIPLEEMKAFAVEALSKGKPVWFGCDCGQLASGKDNKGVNKHVWDTTLLDYDLAVGVKFELDKADRLRYQQSCMTHAMVFTAVDLNEDKKPRKWRVENS